MVYNPAKYKSEDSAEAFELMDKYPFATLISVADGKPFVSHLPLTPKKSPAGIELIGHMARANPHWGHFKNAPVTVIFLGPYTYITPQWYAENAVPTWNYSSIHAVGQPTLIEDTNGIIECLKELTSHVERHWPSEWDFYIPEELTGDALSKSVIGFKIKINEINFKKKLSQTRTPADRAGVLRGLESRTDDNSRAVLKEMQALYSTDGELK